MPQLVCRSRACLYNRGLTAAPVAAGLFPSPAGVLGGDLEVLLQLEVVHRALWTLLQRLQFLALLVLPVLA